MGIVEKTRLWRTLGRVLDSGVGTKVASATGGLVNRLSSIAPGPEVDETIPWTPVTKPLAESRVALVSTGGFYVDGDEPFDVDKAVGDASFREIPVDADASSLRVAHTHFSHRYVDEDVNVLLPLERLRALASAGVLRLAPRAFSFGFGGMLTEPYVAVPDGTAHVLARELGRDDVDLVLLVPA